MDNSRIQRIKDEVAERLVTACGQTGVLEMVDNSKLSGDTKTRHSSALRDCDRFRDKDGHVDPAVQAIMARMYGLI